MRLFPPSKRPELEPCGNMPSTRHFQDPGSRGGTGCSGPGSRGRNFSCEVLRVPPQPPPPPPGLAPSQAETTDGRQGDHEIYRSTEFVQLIDDEEQLMQHKDMVLTVYYALSGRECLTMTWKKNGDGICDLAGVRVRG